MALELNREKISEGVNLTTIIDKKFKSNYILIRFISKLDNKTASANVLIPNILISSNSTYKTRTELSKKLSSLYGSNLGSLNHKIANNQVVGVSASCICDDYALEGEQITSELTDIILDCIFKPCIENDGFSAKDFKLKKQELIDAIDSEINDKRTYAIIHANQTIYKGEPSSMPAYGNRDGAERLEPQGTYKVYLNLLKTAQIEITYAGGGNLDSFKKKIVTAFKEIKRESVINNFESFSPVKTEVSDVVETLDVNQCKMVMGFKSSLNNIYANKLMTTMLGGTAFSKLFVNVREKLSLCYYCSAGYVEGKGVLIIDSGVEKANIQKAREEIINQLNSLAKGDFTDDEMKNAILSISGDYKSNYDSTHDLTSWYFIQTVRGTEYSPYHAIEIINKLTRENVIEAASSFKLDTVYVVQGEDKGGDE